MDAIIVPTIRRPQAMLHAITLAAKLDCALVALCSGKYTTADAVSKLAAPHGIEVLSVDVDKLPVGLLPEFKTTVQLENTRCCQRTDISLKRNLGLLIARVAGWERIVFLDDDIEVPDPHDLRRAAALTDHHAGCGLIVQGFPDNSVVCHAYREAGGAQDSFVGGGALAVHTRNMSSFFPKIYNEDWFYLLGGEKLRPTAATGIAIQKHYDPFAQDTRARSEELGDLLAEGLFWVLDESRSLRDADLAYWSRYLEIRNNFILETMEMVRRSDVPAERKPRMLSSLTAARGRSQYIRAEWCEEYVRNWRIDRQIWRQHLERIQPSRRQNYCKGDLDKVVAHLGLMHTSTYLPAERLDHHIADLHLPISVEISG